MKKYFNHIPPIIVAIILLQTLWFKFTGDPSAIALFSTLGVEPWGRITVGIFELVTSVLILIPKTRMQGALGAVGLMLGAMILHIFVLGISVQDDGGLLFGMAVVTFIAALGTLIIEKNKKSQA